MRGTNQVCLLLRSGLCMDMDMDMEASVPLTRVQRDGGWVCDFVGGGESGWRIWRACEVSWN